MATQEPEQKKAQILLDTVTQFAGERVVSRAGLRHAREIIRIVFFAGHRDPTLPVYDYIESAEHTEEESTAHMEAFAAYALGFFFRKAETKPETSGKPSIEP